MKDLWTIPLILILIADSVLTLVIGAEASSLMLWVMKRFELSLVDAMILRLLYCLPLLYIVNRYKKARLTLTAYCTLYVLAAASTILLGML